MILEDQVKVLENNMPKVVIMMWIIAGLMILVVGK